MVKRISTALSDAACRTLATWGVGLSYPNPEPKMTVEAPEQKAVSGSNPGRSRTKTNEASGRAGGSPCIPFDRRLGTNLTDENYLALRIKSVETNMTTQALLNAAVEQCFVNGGLDMELARKYAQTR